MIHQLERLTAPHPESVASLVGSWVTHLAQLTATAVLQCSRWRTGRVRLYDAKFRMLGNWTGATLDVPVFQYNASKTLAEHDRDQSMGMARYLTAGFRVRVIPNSDHQSILVGESGAALIAAINQDRTSVQAAMS